MPRIRTIKPEFWADEKLAQFEPVTRLVFLGLISMADDAGRLVDNVKALDGMLFPQTDDTCDASLKTLSKAGRILRYTSSSGQKLIQILNWSRHQRVDHPNTHVLPAPSKEQVTQVVESTAAKTVVAKGSRKARENGAKGSREPRATTSTNDLRPTTSTNDQYQNGAKAPSSGSDKPNTDVRTVFDYWVQKTGRSEPKTKLTAERRLKIVARLKRFSAEDLQAAIDGLMLSEFHSSKAEYTDLVSCFGNDSKVESHIARAVGGKVVSDNRSGAAVDEEQAWIDKLNTELR